MTLTQMAAAASLSVFINPDFDPNYHGFLLSYVAIRSLLVLMGEWLACGPTAQSRRSMPCVLQRLADGYRVLGDAIEQQFTFGSSARIRDSCPRCDYRHIQISKRDGRIVWRCPACDGYGEKPSLEK